MFSASLLFLLFPRNSSLPVRHVGVQTGRSGWESPAVSRPSLSALYPKALRRVDEDAGHAALAPRTGPGQPSALKHVTFV